MKGSNSMSLNEATMIEVVQYWLDNQWSPGHKTPLVKGVKPDRDGMVLRFNIDLSEDTEETS